MSLFSTQHLAPRTLLITGASSGIGAALAEAYAAPGMTLYVLARNETRLAEVAARCRALGAVVHAASIDVCNGARMREQINAWDDATPMDLVIANAGISAGSFVGDESADAIDAVFAVNVQGVLNTIQPLLPRMVARGRGQVAIMSSLAGLRALPSAPAYSASKAAVRVYSEALRPLLAKHSVHVSVICPGWITTPLTAINNFPMPFEMPAAHAATIIKRGITRRKSRIAFPLRLYFPLVFLAALPNFMTDFIFARLPAKPQKI